VTTLQDRQMLEAAQAAVKLIEPGMTVGLGTGRTVARLLPALAARRLANLRCVATSDQTRTDALALGLAVEPFDELDRLDIAIDGADQVTHDRWAIKGGHGAHLREKIVAAAAERFFVIASADKRVQALRPPVPLELESYGLRATLRTLGSARLRERGPTTPDGGIVADYLGAVPEDHGELSAWLDSIPGVVGHGLFGPNLIAAVIVKGAD
jgi:ribose 5-phosphate isomerase A